MRGYSSLFEQSCQHTSGFGGGPDLGGGSERLPVGEGQVVLQIDARLGAPATAEAPGDVSQLHAQPPDPRGRDVRLALLLVVEVLQEFADGFDRCAEEPLSGVVGPDRRTPDAQVDEVPVRLRCAQDPTAML